MDVRSVTDRPAPQPCDNCGLAASRLWGRVVLASGVIAYACGADCAREITTKGRVAS